MDSLTNSVVENWYFVLPKYSYCFFVKGGVKEVRLLTDKNTGRSKGCAYIDFVDSKSHKVQFMLLFPFANVFIY